VERRNDEAVAAVLWNFIQCLRERDNPPAVGLDGLTPAGAEELVALFRTAEGLRAALDAPIEVSPETAATRVQVAIARRRQAQRGRAPQPRSVPWRTLIPSARYGWAFAVAGALIVGVIAGSHLPAPDPLLNPPVAVASLTHEQTLARMPRLIAGNLSASESRAMMWHLAHCDECFEVYAQMTGARQRQSRRPATLRVAQWSPAMIHRHPH
jgi:hypothetical protein